MARLPGVLALLFLFSLSAGGAPVSIPVPSGAGAGEPFLFAGRSGLLLSWLTPVPGTDRHALKVARWIGRWSEPVTVVDRNDLFVNWADFPSVIEDGKGVLYAHWLQKSGKGKYSYDVRLSISKDGGRTWGASFVLNRDGKEAEHGFVSLVPLDSGVAATWLDGRKMTAGDHGHESSGDMTIRYATVSAGGTIAGDSEIDGRTCECCTTGMVMTKTGPVVAYRDRSAQEIRDIYVSKRSGNRWSAPKAVRQDGWKIEGCPVNGPQIDASGEDASIAWFTAAGDQQRVYAAFSTDGGATWGAPITVDDGKPVGRVDVVMIDASTAVVTWLEQTAGGGEIRMRRVSRSGARTPSTKIADSGTARAAGFARIARVGPDLYIAWTEQSASSKQIRIVRQQL